MLQHILSKKRAINLSGLISVLLLTSCTNATVPPPSPPLKVKSTVSASIERAPKNIIMVIADGMGPAYTSAYRMYKDDPDTEELETTLFDDILLGTVRTHPHPQSGYVTDSAASATAMAAGIKTYNGAIGMDVNKVVHRTVLHSAKEQGMKTGLAVTSTLVHATPASYMVANERRRNYEQIADSYFDDRIGGEFLADLMLGGGKQHFIREDRNLAQEFAANGYQIIDSYDDLSTLKMGSPVLGLFADNGLPWSLDDSEANRLSVLTQTALEHLNNNKGFFLLVEASQVDWAGHGNDIASAMAEMDDLVATMQVIQMFANDNPDTLVLITADHSTGGLTVAGEDGYRWDPVWIKGLSASIRTIANGLLTANDRGTYVSEQFGFQLNEQEIDSLVSINTEMSNRDIEDVLKRILDQRTNTGWTTYGHTAVDVNMYGYGPGAHMFSGNLNNTDIALKLFELLEER